MTKRTYIRNIQRLRRTQGCFTDCVAYYFNIHPENVPYFVYPRKDWMKRVRTFFNKQGFDCLWNKTTVIPKRGLCIVSGPSKKWKTAAHSVVYKNGKLIYDPNFPSTWRDKDMTHRLDVFEIL